MTSAIVEYQVVSPGHYVRITDGAYRRDWTPAAMRDDGTNGDAKAGDGVWTAIIPGQRNRSLVRYRIVATDARGGAATLPFPEDPTPNLAWFVDDGVPDYVADRKSYAGPVPHVHSADALAMLPVYRLIADAGDLAACWLDLDPTSDRVWPGTFVAGGEVYDHIRYRLRGGIMRGVEKKSFKIKFNRGRRLERTDDFGRPDPVKRSDLDLNSAFQIPGHGDKDPGDPGGPGLPDSPRGECGLYDALAFSLFRWMGVPAPATDWVHLRVIRGESEAGGDQYSGDFFGIYLDVETAPSRSSGGTRTGTGTWTSPTRSRPSPTCSWPAGTSGARRRPTRTTTAGST